MQKTDTENKGKQTMGVARELLKSQKAELFKVIEEAGLNPADFEWGDYNSKIGENYVARGLSLSGTEYYFLFDQYWVGGDIPWLEDIVFFSPGDERIKDEVTPHDWNHAKQLFTNWLDYLNREIGSPDYWAQLSEQAISASPTLEEPKLQGTFDDKEKKHLHAALNRIEHLIKENVDLNENQVEFVNRELTYLRESSNRLNKKDWTLLAIGGIINIATQLGLSAPVVHELFVYLREGLGGVIKFLGS